MEDNQHIAEEAAAAVMATSKIDPRINILKNHVQKLVPFLEHAQKLGAFNLEQSSQVFAILMAVRDT